MKKRNLAIAVAVAMAATTGGVTLSTALAGAPPPAFTGVKPQVYDPADTDSAAAAWVNGIGCPNATATHNTNNSSGSFTDPACTSGFDPADEENAGLLLSKEGPTVTTNSAGTASLAGIVKGLQVNQLGYDIRTVNFASGMGSHCGAGAPRFEVTTTDGTWDIGCNSPPATTSTPDAVGSNGGWTRLRWGNGTNGSVQGYEASAGYAFGPITGTVQSINIVFDEGTDTGPDYFGAAVLDNIEFNGAVVGRG